MEGPLPAFTPRKLLTQTESYAARTIEKSGKNALHIRHVACAFGEKPMRVALLVILSILFPVAPSAQDSSPPPADPQIELNLVNLPTTRSIARHKGYVRFTHRFTRDLGIGDFGDLASDLFSLDKGSVIGFEYRFGITSALQAGVHRNKLSKTLQVFGRWDAVRQGRWLPVGLSALASIEGLDNLQEGHQPAVGAVVSFTHGRAISLYASPIYVDGTREAELLGGSTHDHDHGLVPTVGTAAAHDEDDHAHLDGTSFVGLGTRLRLLPSVFVVGEISPRLSGHDPGEAGWGVSIEKWTGGHTLALTLTNFHGTTPGQIARGGTDAVYLGLNITRRFEDGSPTEARSAKVGMRNRGLGARDSRSVIRDP